MSRDPIGFAGGLNLYEYASSSPVNFVDPLGLNPITKVWKIYQLWKETSRAANKAGRAAQSGSRLIGTVPVGGSEVERLKAAGALLDKAKNNRRGERVKGSALEIEGGSNDDVAALAGKFSPCGKSDVHLTDARFADGATDRIHAHALSGEYAQTGNKRLHVQNHAPPARVSSVIITGAGAILAPRFMELRQLDPNMENMSYSDLGGALLWDAVDFWDPTPTSAVISEASGI